MKKEELTKLGLSDEQADSVLALAGKDIEKHKKKVTDLEAERDDLASRLATAEETLSGFDGMDPAAVKSEIEKYKQQAADAEKNYNAKLTARDQQKWIEDKLTEYGVSSPYARRQLTADIMAADSGLKWKDGSYFGFDDFMKKAKEQDSGLYQTAEEKQAAAEAEALKNKAPAIVGPTGQTTPQAPKYVPPKIF